MIMTPIIPGIVLNNSNTTPMMTQNSPVTRGLSITPAVQPRPQAVNASDVFNNYLNQFQGNPDVTNTLQTAFNGLNQFNDAAGGINKLYDYMVNQTSPAFNDFQAINQQLGNENSGLLQNQLNQAYQWFGPQGEQTQRVNQYYADLANNIATQNAANLGEVDAQVRASGASAGAARNAKAKVTSQANNDLLNASAKQFELYDNIYKNLGTYVDNYTKSMANNKNQYVRDVYDRLLQYSQGVEQARLNSFQNLRSSQLEDALRRQAAARSGGVKTGTITPEQLLLMQAAKDALAKNQAGKEAISKLATSNLPMKLKPYVSPK